MDESTKTLSVPEAGRLYFRIGRNAAYAAAKRGELPAIKIGARLRVPIVALEKMMEMPPTGGSR
jgi:Helix-turn-helix domain